MGQELRIRGRLTFDEYEALERRTGVRHEFVDGFAYPMDEGATGMVGASVNHQRIVRNLHKALDLSLRLPCEVFSQATQLRTQSDLGQVVYYPDLMVCCEPDDNDPKFRTRPKVVIEVTSPTTETHDRREKMWVFRKLSSIKAYLIVLQDEYRVDHYSGDDLAKLEQLGRDATLQLSPVGLAISIADIYRGVDL
ncbi:MAG: Uma2 family endonuclease [Pseudomonadota bacterium]